MKKQLNNFAYIDGAGKVKGNCDADLVLWAVRDAYENSFACAVLVSSDGDYAGLVKFLNNKNKFLAVLSPNNKCSILLKRTNCSITYLDNQRHILEKKSFENEKTPDADGTA